jgi:hypothetical protein
MSRLHRRAPALNPWNMLTMAPARKKIAFQTGSMCFAGMLSQDKLKTWLKGTERLGRR